VRQHRSVQKRYDVDGDADLLVAIAQHCAELSTPQEPLTETRDEVYYDSTDLRLLRAGSRLSRRTDAINPGWYLTSPVLDDEPDPLWRPAGRGRTVPAEVNDLVTGQLRGAAPKPVARLRTERSVYLFHKGDGKPVAQLVDDRVDAQLMGAQTRAEHWREVSVESLNGNRKRLRTLGDAMRAAGGRPTDPAGPERLFVAELAAAPADPMTRGGHGRGAIAADVLGRYLAAQAQAMVAADPTVRQDLPDSVHKMRVASRRLRSLLKTFHSMFDPARAAALDAELQWIAGVLGDVRDREVQLERFTAAVDDQPPELVMGPVKQRIESTLQPELVTARKRLLTALRGARYRALLAELDSFVMDPPYTDEAQRAARDVLPKLVTKAYRKLQRRVAATEDAAPGEERDVAHHRARKAAKRLRYAGETLSEDFGKDAKRLAKRAEAVQELLGDYQDGVVSRGLLRGLAIKAQAASGESGFTYGILLGLEQARAEQAHAELYRVWRKLSGLRIR
jgi:CHAD domain-containing protein